MRLRIALEHEVDGNLDAVVLPPDIIRWEKKTGQKLVDLQKRLGMDDLAFLAWTSLKRQQLVQAPFETWCDGLLDVQPVAEEAPRPTDGDN